MLSAASLILLAAGAGFDASEWKHRLDVTVPDGAQGYARAPLDRRFHERSLGLPGDLRVAGPTGAEIPSVVTGGTRSEPETLHPAVVNQVRTPDGAARFELDFGANPGRHDRIRLAWEELNFNRAVTIESSDRRDAWDVVKRGYLFDVMENGRRYTLQEAVYPASTRRYLRVTIEGWPEGMRWPTVEAYRDPFVAEPPDELGAVPLVAVDAAGRTQTAVEFESPFPPIEGLAMELSIDGGDLVRAVQVERLTARDGALWVCGGTVWRVGGQHGLSLLCPELSRGRHRLTLFNGDNPRARVTALRLTAPRRAVLFPVQGGGTYRIYTGGPGGPLPSYDLAAVLRRLDRLEPIDARPAEWHENPGYRAPQPPLTERARPYLTPVLAVAAAAIALAAVALMRRVAAEKNSAKG